MANVGVFTKKDSRRIGAAVRDYERRKRSNVGPARPVMFAGEVPARMKIKTAADSNGVAVCQFVDADGDVPSGAGDIPVKVVSHRAVGEFVIASPTNPNLGVEHSDNPVTWVEIPTNVTFPVSLESDGGSAGDSSNYCSFTYTVKDIEGSITLGEEIELTGMGQRILKSAMTAATYGLAFLHTDGTVKLIWCDEVFATQKDCEEEE